MFRQLSNQQTFPNVQHPFKSLCLIQKKTGKFLTSKIIIEHTSCPPIRMMFWLYNNWLNQLSYVSSTQNSVFVNAYLKLQLNLVTIIFFFGAPVLRTFKHRFLLPVLMSRKRQSKLLFLFLDTNDEEDASGYKAW